MPLLFILSGSASNPVKKDVRLNETAQLDGLKGPLAYFLGCVAKDVMVK